MRRTSGLSALATPWTSGGSSSTSSASGSASVTGPARGRRGGGCASRRRRRSRAGRRRRTPRRAAPRPWRSDRSASRLRRVGRIRSKVPAGGGRARRPGGSSSCRCARARRGRGSPSGARATKKRVSKRFGAPSGVIQCDRWWRSLDRDGEAGLLQGLAGRAGPEPPPPAPVRGVRSVARRAVAERVTSTRRRGTPTCRRRPSSGGAAA